MGKKIKTYNKPITIRLEESLRVRLDSYCKKEGLLMSAVIRALLENLLRSASPSVTKKKCS